MMASLPVICAFDAPSTLVKEFGFGLQCKPEESTKISEYITELSKMPKDKLLSLGSKGKVAVQKNYTYQILAKQFITSLESE